MTHPEPSPDPSHEPAAIFRREGETLVPSLLAQGPWNAEHLHGGPICGVLARAIESCASPVPMRVVRLTVEMTRPVSLHVLREPRGEWIGLHARTGIEADGIGQSSATLFDRDGAVARALVSLLVERR